MGDSVQQLGEVPVLVCDAEGAPIATPQDALDVIGGAFGQAEVVAMPVGRLDEQFFRLRSGLAGEVMQKFVNYRVRLVIVGQVPDAGTAFSDLVRESNRGRHVWFVRDLEELDARLARPGVQDRPRAGA
jgi:hypothetical protein